MGNFTCNSCNDNAKRLLNSCTLNGIPDEPEDNLTESETLFGNTKAHKIKILIPHHTKTFGKTKEETKEQIDTKDKINQIESQKSIKANKILQNNIFPKKQSVLMSHMQTIRVDSQIHAQKSIAVDLSGFRTERSFPVEEQYEFLDFLGKGAFGEVKKVRHKKTGAIRAMKIISKEDSCTTENYLEEIEILKKLDHPNILRLYEFFQDEYYYYMVTEYCEGGDLLEGCSSLHNIKEADIACIMHQILSAVKYCHKCRIVHRDMKPENILFSGESIYSIVKVIDFGRSLILKRSQKITEMAGSLYYMSPEIVSNIAYDESSDIWSCGVILYVLLCGNPPFFERTRSDTIRSIKESTLLFSQPRCFCISEEGKSLIKQMLNKRWGNT